jgi:membrane protease YdiL (CAAX protease family)
MRRTLAAPVRSVSTVVAIVAAAGALALRPWFVAAHPIPAGVRTWLLALLYLSIAAASLLPGIRSADASAHRGMAFVLGLAVVAAAWRSSGPAAPLALSAAALPLSVAAAIAEEALFRRLLYAQLRRWGVPVAIGGAALAFALAHLPAYGVAALPVDLGAGLLFGWQRWAAGTWTVPAATHSVANILAVIR